jgi:hypothetical protein
MLERLFLAASRTTLRERNDGSGVKVSGRNSIQ